MIATLALLLFVAIGPAPSGLQQPGAGASVAVQPPEELLAFLDEIEGARLDRDFDAAKGWLEALFEEGVHERLLLEDRLVVLAGLERLEAATLALGELAATERVCRLRVSWLVEHGVPDEDDAMLTALDLLANALLALGQGHEALEIHERILAAKRRDLPPDHEDVIAAMSRVASARGGAGDILGALELEREVLAAAERAFAPGHWNLLVAKSNLALTLSDVGELEEALALQEEVLAVLEEQREEGDPVLLETMGNLARTRTLMGDLEGALALDELVYAESLKVLPPDHQDALMAANNLAVARASLGDLDGALELFEQVLAMRERTLPEGHPDRTQAQLNLSVILNMLGDLEGSLALAEEVLAAQRERLPREHPEVLIGMGNVATARRMVGDLEGARELGEEVLSVYGDLLHPGNPDLLEMQLSLAATLSLLGDRQGMLALVDEMLAGEGALAEKLADDPPRLARAAIRAELARLSALLVLAEQSETSLAARLFETVESLRAVTTESVTHSRAVADDPELAELHQELVEGRGALNAVTQDVPEDPAGIAEWRRELLRSSEARDRAERRLRTALVERGAVRDVALADVAAALAPDAALVSYLNYSRLYADQPGMNAIDHEPDSLLAFVVTPDARVRRVELGPSEEVERLTSRWRASLGRPFAEQHADRGIGSEGSEGSALTEPALGSRLRELLVDPCLAVLGEDRPTTLHVIPDGVLHLIPFDALPAGQARLGDRLQVRVELSAWSLAAPTENPVRGGLVAVGDADYDAGARPGGTEPRFEHLTETGVEVAALVEVFDQHVDAERILLRGAAATKEALRESASRARYLHVATHGWFAGEDYVPGGARAPVARPDVARDVRGFAPETLCGLALAGANRRGEGEAAPGILTAEELTTYDLSACELAVLSACETNVGIRRAGEGIRSLQAALLSAGARAAVTSLWSVDDAATRLLMERFYENLWGRGLGKAEALWSAKESLRAEGRPVRDWGGWVLTGRSD